MKKLKRTADYAKNRLALIIAEDSSACAHAESMTQIKKEIKNVIHRHLNISDDAYDIKIILRDK